MPTTHDFASSLSVVLATLDEAGTLVEANAGFLRILPAAEASPIGRRVDACFIQPDFARLAAAPANSGGEVYRGLMTIGDYAGRTRSLRGRVRRTGGMLQLVAEYDIDELERHHDAVLALNTHCTEVQYELAQANLRIRGLNEGLERQVAARTHALTDALARAEAASRAKSAFLANISHEFRTPMNGVLGMTYLIRRGGITSRQAGQLDNVESSTRHLLAIVSDILDLAEAEAGKSVLQPEDFALAGLVDDVVEHVRSDAIAKNLALHVDLGGMPPLVRGDPMRLRQALQHYLANAVKFTAHGSITLEGRLLEEDAAGCLLRFAVIDTGIGIAAGDRGKLFAPFQPLDESSERLHGGTGLGLAITRQLVKLMGGEVGVDSVRGAGSTFWFTARLAKSNDVRRPPPA